MEITSLQIILLVSWFIGAFLDYAKVTREYELPSIYIPAILTLLYGFGKGMIWIVNGTI